MRTARKLWVVEAEPSVAPATLPESHDKYEALFDQASDAIFTVTVEGVIDAANQAAEELSGFLKSELLHQPYSTLVPNPKTDRIPERTRPLDQALFEIQGTYEDVAILRKDGYVRLVDLTVRKVMSSENSLTLLMMRDVTEKKRMERELITKHAELKNAYMQLEKRTAELQSAQETLVQAGKLAALGELAAGIAHELNQPLQGIRGYAQELQSLALPHLKHVPESESCLKEIVSNVDKMAQIIQYLRTFVRKSVENFEMTDVHHTIEEAMKMLSRQFASRGIQVNRDYGRNVPQVYANPLQLEQVFINFATNARDAIEETGRGKGSVTIVTRAVGKLVEIRFSDDGVGMSERTKAKTFNPFFTTKEVGKGMGLGLSLSYGMISKLHGTIVVESEVGKGTQFIVRLPQDYRELG